MKGRATHYRAIVLTDEINRITEHYFRTETDFGEPGYYLTLQTDPTGGVVSVGKKVGLGEHCRRLAFTVELLERTKD